jgi:hypothetical protein
MNELSPEDFSTAVKSFCAASERLGDSWSLREFSSDAAAPVKKLRLNLSEGVEADVEYHIIYSGTVQVHNRIF